MEDSLRMLEEWTRLETLFGAYVAGDLVATRALFAQLSERLRHFFEARARSESDAEDLTQVALLKVHFARDRFDRRRSLKSWVFTIAGRCLIDHWRAGEARASEGESGYPGAEGATREPYDGGEPFELRVERGADLTRALATLRPMDQTIVYLYGVEGFSMAEIAEMLRLSEGAVKARASRSYRVIRPLLTAALAAVVLARGLS